MVVELIPTEEQEQEILFQWAQIQSGTIPELALLHAIPNGGKRPPKTALMLKRTGLKPGVPDMFLPVSRGGKHGLYIELKRIKHSTVSAAQVEWMNRLSREGYECAVCKGWQSARDTILRYLNEK